MRAALLLGMALTGCGQANDAGNVAVGNGAADVAPGAAAPPVPPPLDGQQPLNAEAAAPEGAAARYVGRWAANTALCENGAWRFEERRLATAGEVSCDFDRVTQVAGGYNVTAVCQSEGTKRQDLIRLRFAESADAMLVESETFRPVGLVRCGG